MVIKYCYISLKSGKRSIYIIHYPTVGVGGAQGHSYHFLAFKIVLGSTASWESPCLSYMRVLDSIPAPIKQCQAWLHTPIILAVQIQRIVLVQPRLHSIVGFSFTLAPHWNTKMSFFLFFCSLFLGGLSPSSQISHIWSLLLSLAPFFFWLWA